MPPDNERKPITSTTGWGELMRELTRRTPKRLARIGAASAGLRSLRRR